MAFESGGRIVVVGSIGALDDFSDSYGVVRLLGDGRIHRTFGRGGAVTTRVGFITDDVVSRVVLQPGRIVVGTLMPTVRADVLVLRFLGGP